MLPFTLPQNHWRKRGEAGLCRVGSSLKPKASNMLILNKQRTTPLELVIRTFSSALPEGSWGVPRPTECHSPPSGSWVFPEVSSWWNLPRPSPEGVHRAPAGSSQGGGAVLLLRAPPGRPSSLPYHYRSSSLELEPTLKVPRRLWKQGLEWGP